MSVIAGPLSEEPMMGVCFIVESVNILEQPLKEEKQEVIEEEKEKEEKG